MREAKTSRVRHGGLLRGLRGRPVEIHDGWVIAASDGGLPATSPLAIWKATGALDPAEPDYTHQPTGSTAGRPGWELKSSDGASRISYFHDQSSNTWVFAKIGVHNDRRRQGVAAEMTELLLSLNPAVVEWKLPRTTDDGYAFAAWLQARYAGRVSFRTER